MQQEQSSQAEAVIVGAVAHVARIVYGIVIVAVAGAEPEMVSALTSTGKAAPVFNENA